ncbi:type III secretion protein HrpB2 [Burkholderia lata]|uniref:Type III secretion protein HrpB2 n=1 Tax=Burkholderia lata (strain ATCC 17760 / DSM 23089 / LMG 22485 / NCIMB 9086 / R18194 / 383) TaxID=482957 RepID=A0A6P2RQ25_BURL3|nr:type III secretion protein HrpB2 [Burkholderia lata]VWC38170.1 type III secretion protein HrpB2 [Burkholderia lata]
MSIETVPEVALNAAAETVAPMPVAGTPELGDKFRMLMERASMTPPSHDTAGQPSPVANAIAAQDAQFMKTIEDVQRLPEEMPGMSLTEMTDRSVQMMFELANMQMNMQVKMSLVESSKSSVQTLMKNQ